jgi:hypothetical protein
MQKGDASSHAGCAQGEGARPRAPEKRARSPGVFSLFGQKTPAAPRIAGTRSLPGNAAASVASRSCHRIRQETRRTVPCGITPAGARVRAYKKILTATLL